MELYIQVLKPAESEDTEAKPLQKLKTASCSYIWIERREEQEEDVLQGGVQQMRQVHLERLRQARRGRVRRDREGEALQLQAMARRRHQGRGIHIGCQRRRDAFAEFLVSPISQARPVCWTSIVVDGLQVKRKLEFEGRDH